MSSAHIRTETFLFTLLCLAKTLSRRNAEEQGYNKTPLHQSDSATDKLTRFWGTSTATRLLHSMENCETQLNAQELIHGAPGLGKILRSCSSSPKTAGIDFFIIFIFFNIDFIGFGIRPVIYDF